MFCVHNFHKSHIHKLQQKRISSDSIEQILQESRVALLAEIPIFRINLQYIV